MFKPVSMRAHTETPLFLLNLHILIVENIVKNF